jgi:hypothetical protein
MTRALLNGLIILTFTQAASAQGFDPLYKPSPGDEALVGCPLLYTENTAAVQAGSQPCNVAFFSQMAGESPKIYFSYNKPSGNLEDQRTSLVPEGKRYVLKAGTKVKVISKAKVFATIVNAQLVQEPIYEIELLEEPFQGAHLYIRGTALQQRARQLQDDWDFNALRLHTGAVLEADNPKFAIEVYKTVYSQSANAKLVAAAKAKLIEAGVPLPPAMGPNLGKPAGAAQSEPNDESKIALLDYNDNIMYGWHWVYALVRNDAGKPLRYLKMTVLYLSSDDRLLHTHDAYAEPDVIQPGESASIKVATNENVDRIHHFKLTFQAGGRSVKYIKPTR